MSNFAHLQRALIPSMTADFETAFNISLADEKNVRDDFCPLYTLTHADIIVPHGRGERAGQDAVRVLFQAQVDSDHRDRTEWYSRPADGLVRDPAAERRVHSACNLSSHELSNNLGWITEIRPYVYETLMYLVGIHAQVSAAAAPLLERTLNALVQDVADEALRCFRQVKRFGMGGMLRVRLPFSFLTLPPSCSPLPSEFLLT